MDVMYVCMYVCVCVLFILKHSAPCSSESTSLIHDNTCFPPQSNVLNRRAFELEKYRHLWELPISSQAEEEAFASLQQRVLLLENSVLQLDATLLVLR